MCIRDRTQEVKKLFCDTLESYTYKAKLVAAAQVYEGCAISVSDDVPADMMVVVPQAANDLLSISGVEASFVAAVSYTHLDVYKRQPIRRYDKIQAEIGKPLKIKGLPLLL